ncbi:hypothetical protein CJ030_MR1G003746 [Morella rubra]|uniref:Uncharacterized protein n=1 Tax=Morella rubra TaxID=262757 RepID=A0A6A1WR72_9ROSI|nr:hypothetical protein CJ030_MR1G003746 [Morella rubra]
MERRHVLEHSDRSSLNYRSIGTKDYMKPPKSFYRYLSTKSLESSQSTRSHFVLHCLPKCVESSFIVFYVKATLTSKRGRGRTREDHFDLDYTRQEDVRTVVETMMTARRTHRNRMHAYFKKFPSKEAALLKPHPDTTEEQWKELCDLFTSEAFMKRSEQNKKNRSKLNVNHAAGSRSFQRTRACMKNQESGNINPAELYKNYTNKDGIWTSEGAREIYERMDAFQRQCDLEGKTYTEIEVYFEILGKKLGYVQGLGRAVKPPPSSTLTT